ncbi:hypothetical protein TNCV_5134101 [Trichonephila clavipes]|nr:hypothetical protein TNCV_5134101 [Trichonephila clavipes]
MALRRTLRDTLIETRNTTLGIPADGAADRNRDPKPNVGVEKRVKRDTSHTKRTVGTFLGDLKSRVWIKRRGDKSHVKGAVENEKRGGQKDGVDAKEKVGKERVSKERGFDSKEMGFKGDRVSG